MFRTRKKTEDLPKLDFVSPNPIQDQQPITLLDVDDTLTKRTSKDDPTPVFNEELIKALKDSGVTEIYLFSAMSIKQVLPTKELQDQLDISRLALIRHLESPPNPIKVLGIISNYDLKHPGIEDKPPGHYYREVVRPFEEELEAGGPGYDLQKPSQAAQDARAERGDLEYLKAIEREQTDYAMPSAGVKERLAEHFIPWFIEEHKRQGKSPPAFQFIDDRQGNLDEAARVAKKHGVEMKTFLLTPYPVDLEKRVMKDKEVHIEHVKKAVTTYDDYMGFLSTTAPKFKAVMTDTHSSVCGLKTMMEHDLHNILGSDTKNKAEFLVPINRILNTFVHLDEEMKKDRWDPSRDTIKACDDLMGMMVWLKDKYSRIPADSVEKKARQKAITEIDKCIEKLGNMKVELVKLYTDEKEVSQKSEASPTPTRSRR